MKVDTYLTNTWYVAALAGEVTDNLLRRLILDEPVLLFRNDSNGEIAALRDMCPHRFSPLSLGKRVAGGVQCPYHGLVFAPSGKCILNPHGDGRVLPSAKVQAYPAVERYGLIWIWPGDPSKADFSLVPDFSFLDTGNQRTRDGGHMATNANYQLLTDNILDLSHADFLHPLLDSSGGTRREAPKVEELADGSIDVSWTWGATDTLGFLASLFEPDAKVYTRIAVRWYPPGIMHQRISSAVHLDDLNHSVRSEAMHMMTPETSLRTHYIWGGLRNFNVDDDAFTAAFAEAVGKAFSQEDKPMIEASQANMGDETNIFALRPLGLIGDAGGVRAREKLRKLIAAEQLANGTVAEAGALQ